MDFSALVRPGSLAPVTARYLSQLVDMAPEATVYLGIDGAGHGLPELDAAGIRDKVQLFERWQDDLQGIDGQSLTDAERLDVEAYQCRLDLYRYVMQDLARWRHNPDSVSALGELFFMLMTADRASEEGRFEDILARLKDVPRYLRGARRRLDKVDPVWAETALRVCDGMAGLWRSLAEAADAAVGGSLAAQVRRWAKEAGEAVKSHRRWIADETVAQEGLWLLSEDQFDELLRLKALGVNSRQCRELGEHYLHELRAERLRLARSLTHSDSLEDARKVANRRVPGSFAEAVAQVKEFVADSRRFLIKHDLVPMAEHEGMKVLLTPDFFVPLIPFAAMMEAGMYAPVQRSVYMITRPADGDLSGLSRDRFSGIAVHEGYPGHHLQHSYAHRNTSIYRNNPFVGFPVDGAARFGLDLVEGWAHYCEEMMKDHGFQDTVESRFLLVDDQLLRAVRILIDVDLSTGRMPMGRAVDLLVDEVGMPRSAAEVEVRRYTTSPTYQLCYLLGKHKIEGLRDELKQRGGPAFDERGFHEMLLDGGCLPVDMTRRHLLGPGR